MTHSRTLWSLFALTCLLSAEAILSAGSSTTALAEEPRPAWTTSRIKGSPEPPAPYRIESAFPQVRFQYPTSITEIPGRQQLLVTERDGKVFTLKKSRDVAQADLIFDLADLSGKGVALFSATLHPHFDANGYVYVCYVHPRPERLTRVSRFTLTADDSIQLKPDSEQVVITWPAGGHNGGCLEFGKDGYLYVSTGDGSGPNPPDGLTTGQDVSDLLGSILRIDVDRSENNRNYATPKDNPFVDQPKARPEIWAYGLRNPWKFGIDPETGDVYAADNGWETWELIHRIVRGGNCGWPIMEGRAVLRKEVPRGPTPIIPPVKDHPHTEANSVIGGPVYRGMKLPGLQGSFVYGDYITGTIWSVAPDGENAYRHSTLVDTDQRIVGFEEGSDGELFVLDYDLTGQIYELLPSNTPDSSADFPRRLSETGLFRDVETLEAAPGVVAYSVQVPRWLDGASARRWIALPGTERVRLASDENQSTTFPNGTVLVKHVELPATNGNPPLRLETQILHFEDNSWRPYSYLWDEDGSDAQLVDSIGTNRSIQVADADLPDGTEQRTWHVGAHNECRLCHNAGSGFVLGFAINQLNGPNSGGSESSRSSQEEPVGGQLTSLTQQRVLHDVHAETIHARQRLVHPSDESQSLDDRARSYLHANCSMCHHRGGNAIVSFYLRRELPFDQLNTNKGTGIGTFGMRNARLIVPGDPYRSVLMYRMSKLGYGRMPYIGSQVVDSHGVALIEAWIRSLKTTRSPDDSPPLQPNSKAAKSLRLLDDSKSALPAREQAVAELLTSTEGALALVGRLHAGSLPRTDLQTAMTKGQNSRSDIRGLVETFIPESQRRPTLGPNPSQADVLKLAGDAARGKLIYYSDGARCRACHDVADASKSLGPTLTEIARKYPRNSEILQHILQPSFKVDDKFAAQLVATADGQVLTGLLASSSPKTLVLRTADGKTLRIQRSDVEELRRSTKSLMPDQLLSDLTAQEAADLLAYLQSFGPTE